MSKPRQRKFPRGENDAARMAADLDALRRTLLASDGTFSLSFAVCDERALRDSLIERLRQEFPNIFLVRLPAQVHDPFQALRGQLPVAMPSAIFILDLEASVPFEGSAQSALRVLNSTRESWESLRCPVVIWLADYALQRLIAHAPDFWRYHSHQFTFVPENTSPSRAAQEIFQGYEMVDSLPSEEKAFRVVELERRLAESGNPPPSELLPHALLWSYELARLQQQAGQHEEAERRLREALEWARARFGPRDPQTATALNNLAELLRAANRHEEAEPFIRRALGIDESALGARHPFVARDLSNLALLLKATGRIAEAEALMLRAVEIDEASFGASHPKVAMDLSNLAGLYVAKGRVAEAEPLMRRALQIDEAAHGGDHPNVAIHLANLAELLRNTNREEEAEPLLQRSLEILGQLGLDPHKI